MPTTSWMPVRTIQPKYSKNGYHESSAGRFCMGWSCVGPPPGHETDVVAGDEVVRNPVTR